MAGRFQTTCEIAVLEGAATSVSELLKGHGLETAIGDTDERSPGHGVFLMTLRSWPDDSSPDPTEALLVHEIELRRLLMAAGIDFKIVASSADPVEDATWWTVRFATTGSPSGMRVRAADSAGLEVQMQALARFLGVSRAALSVTPEEASA